MARWWRAIPRPSPRSPISGLFPAIRARGTPTGPWSPPAARTDPAPVGRFMVRFSRGRSPGRLPTLLFLLAAVSACASPTAPRTTAPAPPATTGTATGLQLQPVAFPEIPGWEDDDQSAALAAFRLGCGRILASA